MNPSGLAQVAAQMQAAVTSRSSFAFSAPLSGSRGVVGPNLAALSRALMETPALSNLAFGIPVKTEQAYDEGGILTAKRESERTPDVYVHSEGDVLRSHDSKKAKLEAGDGLRGKMQAVVSVPHSFTDCETGQTVNAGAVQMASTGFLFATGQESGSVWESMFGDQDGETAAEDNVLSSSGQESSITDILQGCPDWVKSRALTSVAAFPIEEKRAHCEVGLAQHPPAVLFPLIFHMAI